MHCRPAENDGFDTAGVYVSRKGKIRKAFNEVIRTNNSACVKDGSITVQGIAVVLRKLYPKKGNKQLKEMLERVMDNIHKRQSEMLNKPFTGTDESFLGDMKIKLRE